MTSTVKTESVEGVYVQSAEAIEFGGGDFAFVGDCRAGDAVSRLSRQLNDVCTAAVTPHQIAALLEAEGLNDRLVEERYGRPGVFPLADELYRRVPLRRTSGDAAPPPAASAPIPQASARALIMRGPLYLAPLAFVLAAGGVLEGPRLLIAGMLSLLLAWVWNQGFGALTHRLLGRLDVAGARKVARLTLLAGVVVVTVAATGVTSVAFGWAFDTALFSAAQSAYLIGAAMLLVFGRDKLLAVTLAPGLFVVSVSLLTGGLPQRVIPGAAFVTAIGIVAAAIAATRTPRRVAIPHIGPQDRSIAMVHAFLGLAWALVIGLGALAVVGVPSVLATVGVGASGMVLTMGVAEWQLLKIRGSVRTLLIESEDPSEFAGGARLIFVRAMGVFSLSLVLSSILVVVLAASTGLLTNVSVVLAIGFGFLGCVFFAGLALVSMNRYFVPFAGAIALIVEVGAVLYVTSLGPALSAGIFTLGCGVLCVWTVTGAMVSVAQPVLHR